MAKKRARSKSTPPAATAKRPAAPALDLAAFGPPPAPDTLVPVSSRTVAEPTIDPLAETSVALLEPRAPDRLTLPACPRSHASEKRLDLARHDDDHAADAFFASAEAAVAREAAAEREAARRAALEEAAASMPPPPAPELVARRRVLRRAVSAVVGVAAVFAMIAGVSVTQARAGKKDARALVLVETRPAAPVLAAAPPARAVVAPVAVAAEAVAPVVAPVAVADEAVTPVVVEPAVVPEAVGEKAVDPAAAKALSRECLGLLERGAFAKAIAKAEASIDADPSDASPYLYWGTALMETGKRAEAKQIFATCVAKATRGPKHECAQFK